MCSSPNSIVVKYRKMRWAVRVARLRAARDKSRVLVVTCKELKQLKDVIVNERTKLKWLLSEQKDMNLIHLANFGM